MEGGPPTRVVRNKKLYRIQPARKAASMQSYITHSIAVYEGILKDAAIRWPKLQDSFGKDLSYLLRAVEARGLPFLTVVLPSMGKVLDKSLDQGFLPSLPVPQGYPMSKGRPVLFKGLYEQIFDDCGNIVEDAPVDAVMFLRQLLYMAKKLRLECSDEIKKETLNEFFKIDTCLPPIEEDTWGSSSPKWKDRTGHPFTGMVQNDLKGARWFDPTDSSSPFSPRTWDSLRLTCRRVISELGEPDWWEILPQFGPGAVSEKVGKSSKFDFPNWPAKLESVFPFDWFGVGILDHSIRYYDTYPENREIPSKLHMVLKDFNGPRLICAEPISHSWIQQGIWKWMDARMRSTFIGRSINLRNQQNSRDRALVASQSAELATIDLSSASDRLSARLVEYVFQGSTLLDGFNACRTQYVHQDIESELSSHLALRKFSTQGSALTMPVQSLVYLILTIWAIKVHRGTEFDVRDIPDICRSVTVYGDDIIAPAECLETIELVLHECGLKVNSDKTYGGHVAFRESCGIQAFRGSDVTYVRILKPFDDSPSSMATTIEVSNNLFKSGYWNAAKAVMDQVPEKEFKLLRISGPDDGAFGLYSFCGTSTDHLKKVWNKSLQRLESISLSVTSKVRRTRGRGVADLSQYFFEKPNPDFVWGAGRSCAVKRWKSLTRVAE